MENASYQRHVAFFILNISCDLLHKSISLITFMTSS